MGGQSRRQLRKGAVLPTRTPLADFDSRYSDPGASATDWEPAREILATTELSWLTTVRPDGRPHTTPLITVWHDGAVHFCTGPEERKHKNLDANPYVVLAAGPNAYADGLDVVLEGETGFLVDEHDVKGMTEHMIRMLNDPQLAGQMGARAQDRIRTTFSREVSLEKLWNIILACKEVKTRKGPATPWR